MKLSQKLQQIFKNQEVTVAQILKQTGSKSFGFLLALFALPSALPIPAPGYSIPFALILMYLAKDLILAKDHPGLPKEILDKKIKIQTDKGITGKMFSFLVFFENFLKPRFGGIYQLKIFRSFLGIVVLVCSLLMLIPIPFTNTLPAFTIFLIGVSMTEEDGLFLILTTAIILAILTSLVVLIALGNRF